MTRSRLQRYLAAHVARDRDLGQHRTVREFIAEFRGLSGTAVQRKVLDEVGCSHQSLAQFFGVEQVNRNGIAKLLAAMRKHSKPVAPKHLGVIGVDHFKQRFLAAGGNIETFKYQCRKGMTPDGIPYVVEFAFGLHQSGLTQGASRVSQVRHRRELERRDQQSIPRLRINWRRTGEHLGQGAGQRQTAGDLRAAPRIRVSSNMPTAARPRSSSPTMRSSPMTENEKSARPAQHRRRHLDVVETATSKWTRQKKSEERHPGMIRYRASRMTKEPRTTQKEAAWEIME